LEEEREKNAPLDRRDEVMHDVLEPREGYGYSTPQKMEYSPGLILLFSTTSRPALGPTQPPIQWVLGTPSLE
jgi:hypothetical protein